MNLRDIANASCWWGKLIGAFFGYLTAGPLGALIGIIIGNLFDRGLRQHLTKPHWRYHLERRKEVQKIFYQATFLVLGHVAKSDGRVSSEEINMAKGVMRDMRLSAAQKKQAKFLFTKGKQPEFNLGRILTQLKQACHDNHELLLLFVDIQYRSAQIDGLNQSKINTLNHIFQCLGFAPLHRQYRFYEDFGDQYQQSHNQQHNHQQHNHQRSQSNKNQSYAGTSLAQAYAILELQPSAGKHEVKRAYRRLISRNHPDKLIAQGLPEEMIKVATNKTQLISKAYDTIRESKGW